ncbi:hypothetical protein B0J18DRAFT_409301 [Chaetomium sp. MPI-SDFR-AT-0129]|nr:hypothetical protein B0J18DRAFT_409301 [Chaetomium sp. MPI-SDFR-AT-0129]
MSSRLSMPVSKLTRTISTSAAVARPSQLLSNAPKATTVTGAGRKMKPAVDEPSEHRNHSTTTTSPHRPLVPKTNRVIPFMQTFHHSAPKPMAPSFSTMDRAILPDLFASSFLSNPDADTFSHIPHLHVPLMPDNTSPPAQFRRQEAPDAPLPQPEILVVAANPELVRASALTEVEGMGVDGVELGFAHLLGRESEAVEESYEMGEGMIRDLWRGMVDDVFGGSKTSQAN